MTSNIFSDFFFYRETLSLISKVSNYEVMINYPLFIRFLENCATVCIFARAVRFTWKINHNQIFSLEYSLKYLDRTDELPPKKTKAMKVIDKRLHF